MPADLLVKWAGVVNSHESLAGIRERHDLHDISAIIDDFHTECLGNEGLAVFLHLVLLSTLEVDAAAAVHIAYRGDVRRGLVGARGMKKRRDALPGHDA